MTNGRVPILRPHPRAVDTRPAGAAFALFLAMTERV
jgi:hypothetical protein